MMTFQIVRINGQTFAESDYVKFALHFSDRWHTLLEQGWKMESIKNGVAKMVSIE